MVTKTKAEVAHLKVYKFNTVRGRVNLGKLHALYREVFKGAYFPGAFHEYIVDHGDHLTLNTIVGGQLVPRMEDLEIV
jgi:predicted NAD/FAD-binding protein